MPMDDNRISAVLRNDHEVVLGSGTRRPQLIGGLTRREARALAAAGPLTGVEWARLHTSKPPSARWDSLVALIAREVTAIAGTRPAGRTVALVGPPHATRALATVIEQLGSRAIVDQEQLDHTESALLLGALEPERTSIDLVVVIGHELMPVTRCRAWQRCAIPHLPVVFSGDGAIIGPLVHRTTDPCALCLELYRCDYDSQWAELVGQLATTESAAGCAPPDLLATCAGIIGALVRAEAQGQVLAAGATIHLRAGHPIPETHVHRLHPHCPRHV